ncbi:hypothetical protein [Metabacillus malikii]|uniref:Uncharacterized protein n=1 Tax=Metabacillus malikii TaxID=1504265 RepID=A0ABT9ZH87_9BACI|nr:hypothetical protein [Metabacillus malikii]MDQ0231657.1 hypothetical protein [Metabacillus malikii]
MKMTYYYKFASILLKRKSKNYPKEIIIGIIVSALLMMVYTTEPLWGNLVVLFYCGLLLITSMVDNETFFGYQDLELFDLKNNTLPFKITYIVQRILLDMYLTNTIIVVSVFIYIAVKSSLPTGLFFLTIVTISHLLMPSANYWAYKVGEQGVILSVAFFVILLVSVIVGCIHNIAHLGWLFSGTSYIHSLLLILFTLLSVIILDIISGFYRSKTDSKLNTRKFFLWLKKLNVFLFKDYVLFYKNILLNLVMIFTLYSLLIIGTEDKLIPFMSAFIIGSSSIFAMKSKKKYTLLSHDPFFDETRLKRDAKYIRITKMMTILSGAVIKISVSLGILVYHKIFDGRVLASLAILMILGSIIEFIVVYRNHLSSTIMNKFLVYTAVLIFGITAYFNNYYTLLWIYLFVLLIYCFLSAVSILRKDLPKTIVNH